MSSLYAARPVKNSHIILQKYFQLRYGKGGISIVKKDFSLEQLYYINRNN